MPKKKKISFWQKIKNSLANLVSTQLWLVILLAIMGGSLLSLNFVATTAYDDWRADKATELVRVHHNQIQGHLDNVVPMIEICLRGGAQWIWM